MTQRRRRIAALPRSLAISLNIAESETREAGRIRAAQIAAIVRLTPVAMAASCLNVMVLIATLWWVGDLQPDMLVWAAILVASAGYFMRGWLQRGTREAGQGASRRAIRRIVINGAAFGAIWGALPVLCFAGDPVPIQLLVGCVSAGMMCAGGFVLGTVPLAGIGFVGMVLAGSYYALIASGTTAIYVGLLALLTTYGLMVVVNLTWNAQLFVEHFLAAERLQREVVARELAQSQVAHAQRMTALGELAGGIAHDFNNILQSVCGSASLAAARAEDAGQVRRLAASITNVAERGGAISRRLLAFARQDTLHAAPIEVADLFSELPELLAHTVGEGVALRVIVPAGGARLLADKAQLETILVNLASNAGDAMPQGGTLRFEAEMLSDPGELAPSGMEAGPYVRLCITDTGSGMEEAILARCVEPFFTTKPKGKGTGLGLSMAKGFAEQSGGGFAIASTPGLGTSVTLWLPWTDRPVPGLRPAASQHSFAEGRHVMVVDDDQDVCHIMSSALRHAGFRVSGARDAADALALLDGGTRVDVLVSDFAMPGMNGIEFIGAARERRPGLPAILLTGHVGDVGIAPGGGRSPSSFVLLQKPIRVADLVRQVAAL